MSNPYEVLASQSAKDVSMLRHFVDGVFETLRQNRSPQNDAMTLKLMQDYDKICQEMIKNRDETMRQLGF